MDVKQASSKVLYITYDGLTDPLGQSQVLPYLFWLSKKGYHFTVLSFEKKERLKKSIHHNSPSNPATLPRCNPGCVLSYNGIARPGRKKVARYK